MSKPSTLVRADTYRRDHYRCVSCGTFDSLQWQHRTAEGMGGSKLEVTTADGVTSCAICNPAYESSMQTLALASGWKLKRYRGGLHASQVPFYVVWERQWYLPLERFGRRPIIVAEAMELIFAAGGTVAA